MDKRRYGSLRSRQHEGFDEREMTIELTVYTDDDEEVSVKFPAKLEVCNTCEGKGKHTSPSIDENGISGEEMADDPDFCNDYLSGAYDVQCYECHGKRVTPTIDESRCDAEDKEMLKIYRQNEEDFYQHELDREQERRWGC